MERNGQPRPERTPPDWIMQQAAKSGIQPREVADTVKQLWTEADTARSFAAALPKEGFMLALGNRDLVVLDRAGDVHTLARCLNLRVADIRERMTEIDRSKLPTVEQAREAIREQNAKREKPAPAEPARGTLAGGDREKEQPRQHAANDNTARAEIRALAAMLQKQKGEERGTPVNDNEAAKERMLAFGFDPATPATLAKWQDLGGQVDAGRITEKDRLREMAQYLWLEADRERRAGHQPQQPGAKERQQGLDRDR